VAEYQWKSIEDIPQNWQDLKNENLHSLASAWQERILQLQDSDQLKTFNEKLTRQWAIETGIIERLYTIDRGITQLLIEKGIEDNLIPQGSTDKSPSLIVSIIRDQKEVVDGLFDFVAQRRELTNSYIKQMHQVFTRNQAITTAVNQFGQLMEVSLVKGDWKKWPNNPKRPKGELFYYCPPEQVSSEMDNLILMLNSHKDHDIPPEVEAAWLHHRFTQIHPFQDGNGRIARALASLIFLRNGWFPLVITNDKRAEYIEASEKADEGDLEPLTKLFSQIEINAFRNALKIADNIPVEQPSIEVLISQGLNRIKDKRLFKQNQAFDLSQKLEQIAHERLISISEDLNQKIKRIDNNFWVSVTKSESSVSDFWYRQQIIDIANKLDYYANINNYRAWVQLKIQEERIANITFSFHGLGAGSKFLGLMAVSAFLEFRTTSEEDETNIEGPILICQDIFQFSYRESESEIIHKFNMWLEETIMIGIGEWQNRL